MLRKFLMLAAIAMLAVIPSVSAEQAAAEQPADFSVGKFLRRIPCSDRTKFELRRIQIKYFACFG